MNGLLISLCAIAHLQSSGTDQQFKYWAGLPLSTTTTDFNTIKIPDPTPLGPVSIAPYGRLAPPKDVTAEESAWLSVLVLQIALHVSREYANPISGDNPDYAGFVREHHLERLFQKATP